MAVKPRIHWAWDGTHQYSWSYNSDWLLKAEMTQDQRLRMDDDELHEVYVDNGYLGWIFQFADPLAVHSFKLRVSTTRTLNAWVTNEGVVTPTDYNPVGDAQWTQVLTGAGYTTALALQEFALSPIVNTKWLAISSTSNFNGTREIQLFGEYSAPRFEFWNVGETAELNTAQYPLAMPNAPNIQDYNQYIAFKVKNTHSSTHSYDLTVAAMAHGGDTVILNYYKLGKYSDGYTKSGTISISGIAAGAFSEELRIFADVAKAANPADGLHYFWVNCTETV